MIVAPGNFRRNASASSAVMKSPETNSPAPSMKKHRSASPSQAMPMSAFSAIDALDDVAAVLFDERICLVVREAAVDLEAQARGPAWETVEQFRRDEPAHPAAGVEDDVERPDHAGIDERHDVLDVLVEQVLRRDGAAAGRRRRDACRRQRRRGCPRSLRRRSAGTPPAGPSSCRCTASGLCDAVISTPPSCRSRATAKYSMSVGIMP